MCFVLGTRELRERRSDCRIAIENCKCTPSIWTTATKLQKALAMQFSIRYTRSFQTCNCLCSVLITHSADVYNGIRADLWSRQLKWSLFTVEQNNLKCEMSRISSFANCIRLSQGIQPKWPQTALEKDSNIFYSKFYFLLNINIENVEKWRLINIAGLRPSTPRIEWKCAFLCWRYHWPTLTVSSLFSISIQDLFQF